MGSMPMTLGSQLALPQQLGPRKRRTHILISDYERSLIRQKHKASPSLTQKQLAAWATTVFRRPISQATISDSLQAKYARLDSEVVVQKHNDHADGHALLPYRPSIQYGDANESFVTTTDIVLASDVPVARLQRAEQWRFALGLQSASALPLSFDQSSAWFPRLIDAIGTSVPSHQGCHADNLTSWFSHLSGMVGKSPILDEALQTFALYHVAVSQNDKAIAQKSRLRYGHALSALQKSLTAPQSNLSLETVTAIMVMSLFEYCSSTGSRGWLNHVRGAVHMITLMGPEAFADKNGLYFLRIFSRHLTLAAVKPRDWRFIHSPEFGEAVKDDNKGGGEICCKHVAFLKANNPTDTMEYFEFHKGILSATSPEDYEGLLPTIIPLLPKVFKLQAEHRRAIETLQAIAPPIEVPSNDNVYPVFYQYESPCHAYVHISFRSGLLVLNRVVALLRPDCNFDEENSRLADDFCKSAEFIAGFGFLGAATLAPDFWGICLALPPEKRKWITKKLNVGNFGGELFAEGEEDVLVEDWAAI